MTIYENVNCSYFKYQLLAVRYRVKMTSIMRGRHSRDRRKMAIAKTEVNSVANLKTYGKIVLTLQNCLLPTDKFDTTPSCVDGLDLDMECDLRILGCELIQTAGILLRLPQVAMATGQVLFQRFFHSKSFIKHNMEIVAMGCVCLASKIEEAPRRIRDVINVFHHIKQVRNKKTIQPLILDQNYINVKNQVIKAERRVLKELGFCVHVKHPHKIIVMYLQVLECEKNHRLMQTSWNYMNDSLRTPAFLRYQPETVACACIYLSARQLKIQLPNKPAWYLIFGVTEEDIQDICMTILRLYTRKRPDGDKLEKSVEEIRKIQLDAKLKAKGISGNNTPQGTGSGFSPSSRPGSPRQDKSPSDIKKEKVKDELKHNADKSPRNRESNHVKKRSRTPDSNKSGHVSRSSGSTASPSPKRKTRTPPRGYKDTRKSNSRSRTRSRSRERHSKESKHRVHKRRRSRSVSRSRSRSPHRISNIVSSKKAHHKDTKARYKRSQSRDRERERERNHRERSRSRSRSYDKYKSRKDRSTIRDNGHHHRRSRSRDRSRR